MGQINPFKAYADVIDKATGGAKAPSPSPSASAPSSKRITTDIALPAERVSWADASGKRMSGTKAERDAALAKKPTATRSLSKR